MARPVTIKDETIIAAAREVFLERGIGATTAEVAGRAGVSEGSVFKRFKSKGELFRAAMGDRLVEPPFLRNLGARVGKGDVRENLFILGMEIIAFFRELIPLMMMAWSNQAPNGLPSLIAGPNPPPVRVVKVLTGYLEAEMRAGRLRRHDPEVVARSFLGSLHHFAFFELLHRVTGELPLGDETYVRGLIALLFEGIEPQRSPQPGVRPAAPSDAATPKSR
jgi:AcrR family transcriptional regulator